jgi:hypothetical protein
VDDGFLRSGGVFCYCVTRFGIDVIVSLRNNLQP